MRKLAITAAAATIFMSLTAFADAQMITQTSQGMRSMSHGMSGKMTSKRMKMNRMMTNTKMRNAQMSKKIM
jgi:hypothetical protein